ncbi:MAG: AAA family ATPase [Candidatus Rokubacteria bacterium]|nr:AAA family ATPase [Candidatus Rokubacteria bacterium]
MTFRLELLGGFALRIPTGDVVAVPAKARALLAYLALHPGQRHPRDKLTALLWGDAGDIQARDSLRHAARSLRTARLVSTDSAGFAVDPDALDVDVVRFERCVTAGTPEALAEAADLYRGDLLEGLAVNEPRFEEWLLAERERLRELALETLAKLLALHAKAGSTERAVVVASRLLSLDPLQEAVHRALMRLYARQGRRGAALRQYQVCVSVLDRELGAEPEAETRELYQEILRRPEGLAPRASPWSREPARLPAAAMRGDGVTPDTPVVGRAAELVTLRNALDEAQRGRGRVVAIVGEAGVGKTTVVRALAAEAEHRGARVLLGRSYESEQILPFGPWVDAFRTGQVVADEALLDALEPVWRSELARVLPEVAVPGLPSPGDDYLRLFEAVGQLLSRLAAPQPLVLMLEDVHWADEMTLRLIAFLGRRLPTARTLLVLTAREEDLDRGPLLRNILDELGCEASFTPLPLAPLSAEDTARLVRSLSRVGGDAETIARLGERVWQVSEGNPFVIVEMVRALADRTASALSAAPAPLPDSVRALTASRLERLSDRGRELAAVAAVIGREFEFPLLQRASGRAESEAAEGIEELVRRRILHGAGDGFDFTHDRIRQVIAAGVLKPKRQMLHAAVARALEALNRQRLDEVADQLAYHYSRTTDEAKAVEYLTRFADRATRSYALADAVSSMEEALRRTDRLAADERDRRYVPLVLRLAQAHYFLGRIATSVELLVSAGPRVERLADPAATAPYYFLLGRMRGVLGDHGASVACARRALEEATRCGDDVTAGKALFLLAQEALFTGSLRSGAEHGRAAATRLERTDERWWLGLSHWIVAVHQTLLGELTAAREAGRRLLETGAALADAHLESYGLWTLGWISAAEGDVEASVALCERALASAPNPVGRVNAIAALGYVLLEAGDVSRAVATLEEAVTLGRGFGAQRPQWLFLAMLADAYRLEGRLDDAHAAAVEVIRSTREVDYRYARGWAERGLGRVAQARGRLSDARARIGEALAIFAAVEAGLEVGRTHLDLARLAHAAGGRDDAAEHLCAARALFTGLGLPAWVARTGQVARELDVPPG